MTQPKKLHDDLVHVLYFELFNSLSENEPFPQKHPILELEDTLRSLEETCEDAYLEDFPQHAKTRGRT